MKRPLIIDTDPGIDDALAIFYAIGAPVFDVVGLTTVFGNVPVETSTINAKWLLSALGHANIPVAKGASVPLATQTHEPSVDVHGQYGFGYNVERRGISDETAYNAPDFIYKMAKQYDGALELVALGPLTNLANAALKYPDLPSLLKSVTIMGGAFKVPGNITAFAEANIYNDAKAAEIVCAHYERPCFIGLDVTDEIPLTQMHGELIAQNAPKWAAFIDNMLRYYIEFYASVGKHDGASFHDPATLIALSHPLLFGFKNSAVEVILDGVEQGRTKPIEGAATIKYASSVDVDAVLNTFIDTAQRALTD